MLFSEYGTIDVDGPCSTALAVPADALMAMRLHGFPT